MTWVTSAGVLAGILAVFALRYADRLYREFGTSAAALGFSEADLVLRFAATAERVASSAPLPALTLALVAIAASGAAARKSAIGIAILMAAVVTGGIAQGVVSEVVGPLLLRSATLIALLVAVWLGWVGLNGGPERGLEIRPFISSPKLTVPLAANAMAVFIVLSVPRAGQSMPPSEFWWTLCAAVLGSILVLCLFRAFERDVDWVAGALVPILLLGFTTVNLTGQLASAAGFAAACEADMLRLSYPEAQIATTAPLPVGQSERLGSDLWSTADVRVILRAPEGYVVFASDDFPRNGVTIVSEAAVMAVRLQPQRNAPISQVGAACDSVVRSRTALAAKASGARRAE